MVTHGCMFYTTHTGWRDMPHSDCLAMGRYMTVFCAIAVAVGTACGWSDRWYRGR